MAKSIDSKIATPITISRVLKMMKTIVLTLVDPMMGTTRIRMILEDERSLDSETEEGKNKKLYTRSEITVPQSDPSYLNGYYICSRLLGKILKI